MTYQLVRVVVVIALLIVAAALATPRGKLPLALRGVYRIMRRDAGLADDAPGDRQAPTWKRILAFVLVLIAAFMACGAWACTGMYAGKAVTADGCVILARTVDAPPWTICHRFVPTVRVTNTPGRVYAATPDGFTWPLPSTTCGFVSTPRLTSGLRGAMDSACANDCGLIITGTTTAHARKEIVALDPMAPNGAAENSFPGLLASCCTTAREALDLLAEVIAKKGHRGGEIYMFADKDEAWYVEVYTGHQWAAVRMPDDKVACYGNQFMLREFDPASPDSRHSPDLLTIPEKAGSLVRLSDGKVDLYRSYCGPLKDYSNYRTWFGHHVLSPETAGEYAVDRPMPLFFAPSRKVTVRDFFELQRTRYEGTDRNPEENNLQNVRVIGTTKQATCHVITLDPQLPARFAGTIWATTGSAEHGLYFPLNASVTDSHPDFLLDQLTADQEWNPGIAGNWFRRLSALAQKDRKWYGAGVRKFWHDREDEFLKTYPQKLAAAVRAGDPSELTAWTVAQEGRALADAKAITDELLWYITANNRIEGDGSGATSEPEKPFAPAARPHKTKVLFFFDTEDFTDDRSNDAIRDIANILRRNGVRGNFAMVGELGNFIPAMKRQDVIEALSHHLVGSQTRYHSKYPTINELGDIPDFAEAYRLTMHEEKIGCDDLLKGLGHKKIWCSVFPGPSNSYVGLYVHSALGVPFFGGGNASFTPGEREAAWFVNQFHLPYMKGGFHLETFIPPQPMWDVRERLDTLATHEIVTLYMHPHMAVNSRHWDGVNLKPGEEVEWGKWRKAPRRSDEEIRGYYDRLDTFIKALVNDSRFDVTDCERLYRTFKPRRPITRKEIPEIRETLLRRLGPIGSKWCVADAFQAVVELLRGRESFLPGYVHGFLDPPKGVTAKTVVTVADLRAAAEKLDLSAFIPPEIAVGDKMIGPADFLFAALDALTEGKDEISVRPRDQLGPIAQLMPSLATYSTLGHWGIYHPDYQDKYMTPRLRLQLWTLRYE